MVDQSLIDYISENLRAGFSPEEIRGQVLKYGWNPKDADAAIGIAMSDVQWSPPKKPEELVPVKQKKGHKKLIILAVAAILVVFLLLVALGMIPFIHIPFLSSIIPLQFGQGSSQARFSALGAPSSYILRSNGLLRMNIPNSLSGTIEISGVSVSSVDGSSSCNTYNVPTTVYAGSSKDISIDCTSLGYSPGQSYSLVVAVTYMPDGGYDTVDSATITGLVS